MRKAQCGEPHWADLGEIAIEQTVIASELDDFHSAPAPRLE